MIIDFTQALEGNFEDLNCAPSNTDLCCLRVFRIHTKGEDLVEVIRTHKDKLPKTGFKYGMSPFLSLRGLDKETWRPVYCFQYTQDTKTHKKNEYYLETTIEIA